MRKFLEQMFLKNTGKRGERSENRKEKSEFRKMKKVTLHFLPAAVLLCISTYLACDTLGAGIRAAENAFGTAKGIAAETAYNEFYRRSFEAAEAAHHVSSDISITIGDLREEQKLEVLKVSEVDYRTPENDEGDMISTIAGSIAGFFMGDVTSWLEVPGNGVFTVNLRASEFIVDNTRQYVLIRVPNPELTEFAIDYENVQVLNFEKGGIFKNSARVGTDEAMKQLQSAELTMMQKVNNNQEFYQKARLAAEKMLISIVKQLNPQQANLIVEVEFID